MKRKHCGSDTESTDDGDPERPPAPKQARKQWLKTGNVPRSTLMRWDKKRNADEGTSKHQDSSESSESSSDTSSSVGSEHGDGDDGGISVGGGHDDGGPVEWGLSSDDGDEPVDNGPGDDGPGDDGPGDDGPGDDGPGDDGPGDDGPGDNGPGGNANDNGEENAENNDRDFEEAQNFQFLPDPLHVGSRVTCGEAVLKLMSLYSRHAISKSCLKDLVTLIHEILPIGNLFPSSYYFLVSSLQPLIPEQSAVKHCTCEKCGLYLGRFTNQAVLCDVCGSNQVTVFCEFPLAALIKYMFEKKNLADAIDSYGAGKGSDITRSEEYMRVKQVLPGKYDLQLQWNFDGVQAHNSSSASLYPIIVNVCEVAPNVRDQYTMVVGLWHARKKPDVNSFLMPLTESLIRLKNEGVTWIHPKTNEIHVSKVVAPVLTVDAPARAMAQNLMHHNGEFSCNTCEIEGMELTLGPRSHKRVVPFPDEPAPLRTQESMKEAATKAEAENVIVKGVKGSSILEAIPECDPAKGIALDYMHLVLLGICRQFYIMWFTNAGTDWYIGRKVRQVTNFLKSIRRTYEITRCPQDAQKWKLFKASTWRTWLLFVSLPALQGILKEKYLQHWSLLVVAISLLLKEDISDNDLALAENLLSIFVMDTQVLYGYKAMTYNLHCLLHLPLITKRWGALWAWSLFKFENTNGILTRLLHGTNKITSELSNTLNLIIATNTLKFLMHPEEYVVVQRQFKLLSRKNSHVIPAVVRHALETHFRDRPPVSIFARAEYGRVIFTSEIYTAEKTTDNKTVCFKNEDMKNYGTIQCFVDCDGLYAVIRQLSVDEESYFKINEIDVVVQHLIPVKTTDTLLVIPLSDISCKVFRVHNFVCEEFNHFEQKL